MARPKSFNESKVLTDTMTLFWQKGYEATSMRDLEKSSGLTAGSIYNEFGNKKLLFIRSLNFYVSTIIQWRIDHLRQQDEDPLAGIRFFLVSAIKDVPTPFRGKSCLLINTATELGQEDEEIGTAISKGFYRIEKALSEAITKAQAAKQIKPDINPQLAASNLCMLLSGLLIASKNQSKVSALEAVIDFQLDQISL